MGRLFGTDGIRGIVGRDITCDQANLVGRALIHALPHKSEGGARVIIGMDTRISSDMLADSLAEGICFAGGSSTIIGVCPTPAVAYLVVNGGYDAGVMISASHNPWDYNGIKIFGPDGFKLSDELEEKIEDLLLEYDDALLKRAEKMGSFGYLHEATKEYADYICYANNYLNAWVKLVKHGFTGEKLTECYVLQHFFSPPRTLRSSAFAASTV